MERKQAGFASDNSVIYQTKELPDKLSDLICVALEDLDKAIEMGYAIDMAYWVRSKYYTTKKCSVCLGGAVMLDIFDLDKEMSYDALDITNGVLKLKLYALDHIRSGYVLKALKIMASAGLVDRNRAAEIGYILDISPARFNMSYETDPDGWRDNMNQIVSGLRDLDL